MENGGIEASLEELLKDCTPCIDMEFDSEDAAYRFYSEYGRIVGFCVRKDYSVKSKKDGVTIHRKFVCSKEGKQKEQDNTVILPRRETRTGCKALLYASLDRASLKWYVKKFDATHNHLLHIPETVHMMRNQRGLTESQGISAEIAEATGLPLKLSHDLMSAQSGGREFTGFLREDLKSHLRSKRQRDLEYGEAGLLLRYFEKQTIDNPYFFRSIQLDVDEMITNVFWADHQMIADYGLFGDVISFDTTFRTNKECRPLALFTGFNHFRVTVIFGVALMYDETTPSFVWLFETFLRAMSGKKPFTFFTDQDQAMANAISQVMPDVKHGLCTFHLNQNAMKHLGYLYGPDSTFSEDLNLCMFGYEEEDELDEAWKCLVKNFNLEGNAWIDKTWTLREKWAHVHMKWSFNIGMRSTQLSESLNAKLKKHLKSILNLGQFFTQLDQVIFDKRYIEKEATHDSREKMVRIKFPHCPMLLHVAKLYTPPLFDLFHKQFDISLGCKVLYNKIEELGDEIKFVVQKHKSEREYVVLGHVELDASGAKTLGGVSCSCRKFESYGILCGHAIKVLSHMNVMEIPEKYILGRWRLDAKSCSSMGKEVMVEEKDRKLLIAARYRHLCPRLVTLAAQVCEHDEAYKLVEDTTTSLYAQVDAIMLSKHGDGASSSEPNIDMGLHSIDPNLKGAKGLKRKLTNRASKGGNKRLKPWHEKLRKKAKPSQDIQQSGAEVLLQSPSSNQPMDGETPYYPQTAHLSCQPSCNAPVSEEMTFDRARHSSIQIPTEAKQFFHDDEFIDFCVNSQPPSQH